MQWKQNDFNAAIRAADPTKWPAIIVLFGDDSGQVSSQAQALVRASGINLDDPFASSQLSADELISNPALLAESAGTMSFGGGHRLIRLTGCSGNLTSGQEAALAEALQGADETSLTGVTIVFPVPGIDAKGKLAKTAQKASQAAWFRSYQDNARSLRQVLSEFSREHGRRIAPDAEELLLQSLGANRLTTQNELTKLALYTEGRSEITRDDCLAVLAEAPSANVFALCDAIGNRDVSAADRLMQQLWYEGTDPNLVLSMVARHLQRLAECHKLLDEGMDMPSALNALKMPPSSFIRDPFIQQVRRYPKARLKNLTQRLYQLQAGSRQGILSPEHMIGRGLLALAS